MPDVVFYRKYRPQAFGEVLGQEHVVSVLEDAVASGNVSHAYLFFGSRGTGKTSVARILAREVKTLPEDLHEIDAASNRGIDDIRELREAVKTLPFRSPFKVYIIDEVHMLTKEAWGALLKTLEEPPRHAIFILATTEMKKVPETIASRCQMFTFRKPAQAVLKRCVAAVAKKEGYALDPSAADLVAVLGDGSFRDAVGILERALHSSRAKTVSLEHVERVTSAPPARLVREFIAALAAEDMERGLAAVGEAAAANIDLKLFSKLILERLRLVLLWRLAPETKERLAGEFSEDDAAFIGEIAESGASIDAALLGEMLDAYAAIDHAYLPQLPLELSLVKLFGPKS